MKQLLKLHVLKPFQAYASRLSSSVQLREWVTAFVVGLSLLAVMEPSFAGTTGGDEFKAATDDITGAAQGYGGLLISLLGGVVGFFAGIATGQVKSAMTGMLWAFVPTLVIGVIVSKYSGLI